MKFAFAALCLAGFVAAAADNSTSSSASDVSSAYPSSSVDSAVNSITADSSTGSSVTADSSTASATSTSATSAAPSSSSTASSSSSGPTYQVPSGISSGCADFLTALNKDESIQSCISPGLSALSGNSPSVSDFCSKIASSSCSESSYYKSLSYFSGNCTDELVTNPNQDVGAVFDSLYVVVPFAQVVCTKDQLGKYCATGTSSNSTALAAANAAQTPLSDSNGYPNPDAFASDNLLFLGYNAKMDSSSLCTTCLKNILTTYFSHEAKRPYPAGLASSPLMGVQSDLWSAVQTECPADFVTSTISNTGASPSEVNAASSVFTPARGLIAFLAVIAGVVAL